MLRLHIIGHALNRTVNQPRGMQDCWLTTSRSRNTGIRAYTIRNTPNGRKLVSAVRAKARNMPIGELLGALYHWSTYWARFMGTHAGKRIRWSLRCAHPQCQNPTHGFMGPNAIGWNKKTCHGPEYVACEHNPTCVFTSHEGMHLEYLTRDEWQEQRAVFAQL